MPVCTSWTDLKCPSPTEETPSKWPERRPLWWENIYDHPLKHVINKINKMCSYRMHQYVQNYILTFKNAIDTVNKIIAYDDRGVI